ncbi:MAG: DUF3187 family protein, partial [Planctomycetes bacterium]|nr:DUF3187 family protein [Planctomycetota bacterium]
MRTARVGLQVSFVLLASGCATDPAFGGPLPVRNGHPAQLLVMHMPAASAAVLPAGEHEERLSAAYTSLFLSGAANGNSFVMDGEYLRLRPALRVGLGSGLEAGIAVPFAHVSGGFLDAFVIGYHRTFGFPDQNRDTVA